MDSQWILKYLERMGEHGVLPIIHAMDDTPEEALWKLASVARSFPDLTILALDAFGGFEATRHNFFVGEIAPNIVFDTSLSYNFDYIEDFANQFGAERVVFGTDLYSHPVGRRISHLLPQIVDSALVRRRQGRGARRQRAAVVAGAVARRMTKTDPETHRGNARLLRRLPGAPARHDDVDDGHHHRRDRAALDLPRPRRERQHRLDRQQLPARAGRDDVAVRAHLRRLRPQARPPVRDRAVHGRVDGVRRRADDAATRDHAFDPGHGRGRARCARHGDHRRPRVTASTRSLAGLPGARSSRCRR